MNAERQLRITDDHHAPLNLPMDFVRALGWNDGDTIIISVSSGQMVLQKVSRPKTPVKVTVPARAAVPTRTAAKRRSR